MLSKSPEIKCEVKNGILTENGIWIMYSMREKETQKEPNRTDICRPKWQSFNKCLRKCFVVLSIVRSFGGKIQDNCIYLATLIYFNAAKILQMDTLNFNVFLLQTPKYGIRMKFLLFTTITAIKLKIRHAKRAHRENGGSQMILV